MNLENQSRRNLQDALDGVDPEEARSIEQVWDLAGADLDREGPSEQDVRRARSRLLNAIDSPGFGGDRPAHRRRRRVDVLWPAAAAAVLVGAIALTWWLEPLSTYAPFSERTVVELPDGSMVELNSGSSIHYARSFGVFVFDRFVRLEGEAFFDVAQDSQPFVVRTFNTDVTVVGTRFNVRSWDEMEGSTTVSVEEGIVRVDPRSDRGAKEVMASAGITVEVSDDGVETDSVSVTPSDATAWRRGDFIFKDRMLGVILADVRRRFDVDVKIDPAVAETTKLHMALRGPLEAEDAIRDISGALGLRYRARSNGFEIYQPPASP